MTIEKVEVAYVMIECEEPQGLSGGPMTHSTDGLCRITTNDGVRGIGLGRGAPLDKICKVIHEVFKPLLVGENPMMTREWLRSCSETMRTRSSSWAPSPATFTSQVPFPIRC